MSRKPRRHQTDKSLLYHIINRGILKQVIFHDENDFFEFKNIIRRYINRAKAMVYHWCLMDNHYHIVMELPQPERISKVVGGIQQVYTMTYHKKYKTAGKLFQNRFKSQAIEKELYLLACGRYVEQNPVRAGLCRQAWDWEWSSAKCYVNREDDNLTTANPYFNVKDKDSYKDWLMDERPEEGELFKSSSAIIGDIDYRNNVVLRRGHFVRRGRGRRPGVCNNN